MNKNPQSTIMALAAIAGAGLSSPRASYHYTTTPRPDGPTTFTGPLTTGGIPAARPVTGAAPKGNSGEQGAGESLPFVAGSATSEATAVAMAGSAETDRARILAHLQACRYGPPMPKGVDIT